MVRERGEQSSRVDVTVVVGDHDRGSCDVEPMAVCDRDADRSHHRSQHGNVDEAPQTV